LAQTWAEAVERARPRAAVVVAEGGAGKSRLALELWPRLSRAPEPTAPPTLAWAQADPLRTHVPFAAAAALIRELFGLGEAPTRDALRALGRAHGLDDARAAPLVELSPAHATPPARTDATVETEAEAEPSLRAARVREAAVSLLHARARRGPVLLVVDDAHHADEPSLRLLDEALKPTEGAALLVLALGTPDLDARHPGLFARRASVRLSLPPLAPEAARALVRAALPTVGASTLEGLLEEAEGNPFHLEELARARAEGATQSDSLLSMMETRIARLDPEVRRVLRAASVFGERFDAEGVAHLLARSGADPATGAALRTAVEAELLVPEERAGAHRFRHRLLREAAYAMLPEEDRRVGHRLAAEHLEDAPGAHAEEVAMHLSRAGDEARAVAWLERAARDALRGDDLRGARRLAERGIALRADAGTLHRIAAQALVWLGRTTEALARAEAALATTETGSVDWLLAASVAAVAAGSSGAAERLEEVAEAVLPLAADDDAPAARAGLALALTRAANQLFFAGRLALARRVLARLEAVLDGVDDPAARARLAQVRGIAATYAGDRVTTLAAMREAAEGFEAIGDRRSSCVSLANLGSTLNGVGLFDEAEEVLRRALALSEALELAAVQVPVRLNLSLALLARGQAAEAAELAREATEAVEGSGDRRLEGATRLWWARALLAQGRVEDARARVEAALAPLAQVPTFRALAFAVRARCALATGQVDEALADSGEAMALLEALGALDEGEALVRLVRLEALEATGRAEEAAAVLRDAVAALDAAEAGLPASLRAAAAAIPEQAELRRRATSQGAGRRGGGSMSP
ncbi:MAG TPA: AAA family ATPase, partial [Sandaracinaceae bacterium LLY-WYZ-13_1]|nr:AAA family ATPase [Sandaracinaceae bacterium LLY-WYZ-13_1]